MRHSTSTQLRSGIAVLARALPAALFLAAPAAGVQGEADAIWNDPIFQRQFVAGYGVNAEIEPRVTQDEVEILGKVRALIPESLPKAEATLRKLIKPDCSAILDYDLGSIQFQQDKLAEARDSYRNATTKYPSFRRAWRGLGFVHMQLSEYDEAIRAFTRMIELGGGDAYSYGLLGIAHAARLDYQPAEAAFRTALLMQPDNSEWRLGLTRCVFKQEKFQDAATLLDALIARYPDKTEFWMLQAHTFVGMKQPLSAAGNLEALDRMGRSTPDSLNMLGDIYVNESLPDLAASAYMRAARIDETLPLSRTLRAAEVLTARGAVPQARGLTSHMREAADERLDEAERRSLLKLEARLSAAEGESGSETATLLEEIVRLDPLDGDALILLGRHYARNDDHERAILYFSRAAELEAFEVSATIHQAQVYVDMGRYGDAIPLLRRAQEIKPRDDVARYLEQVERIAKSRR